MPDSILKLRELRILDLSRNNIKSIKFGRESEDSIETRNFKLIDIIELYLGNFAVLMQFVCQETFMCNTLLVFHSDSIVH